MVLLRGEEDCGTAGSTFPWYGLHPILGVPGLSTEYSLSESVLC